MTPEQANAIVAYRDQHGGTLEEAAVALGFTLLGHTGDVPSVDPWAKFVKQDSRIDLQKLADNLKREEGLSDLEALQQAIKMDRADAAPLIAQESKRFETRAHAAAKSQFFNMPEGIELLGKARRAEEAALAERAANMRPELQARGLPVDGLSDAEVVELIESQAKERTAAAEAANLEANLRHIAAMDAPSGGEGA